jgi:hypothetical protein
MQQLRRLSEAYTVSPVFFANYFHKNAYERFVTAVQEFVFWRRGVFPQPHKKEEYLARFAAEELRDYYDKGIFRLHSVQFVVTTRCTLRCRDCSVMMPYFDRRHIDLSYEQFRNDLDAVLGAADYVRTVLLLGGEPLLNKELPQMLEYAAQKEKIGLIDIVTNCTILPWPELLTVAEKYREKVFFGLSNYGGNPELASRLKRAEISARLKERKIAYTPDTGKVEWFRYELRECALDDAQLRAVFAGCQWHHCLYVLDGVLSICARGLAGHMLGAYALSGDERLDLRLASSWGETRKKLLSLYEKDILSACRWCLRREGMVTPALQMK